MYCPGRGDEGGGGGQEKEKRLDWRCMEGETHIYHASPSPGSRVRGEQLPTSRSFNS